MPESRQHLLSNVFRQIDERNDQILKELKGVDTRVNKVMNYVKFRSKVDKIEVAYNLIVLDQRINHINRLTKKTSEKLLSTALKKTNNDERMAISSLFDPSLDVEV